MFSASTPSSPFFLHDRWHYFLSMNKQPLGLIKACADISRIL
jgi:hypothetical protein